MQSPSAYHGQQIFLAILLRVKQWDAAGLCSAGLPRSFWQSEAGNGIHKGIVPSADPLPCSFALMPSFDPRQHRQANPGILSGSMDAIIFAKLGMGTPARPIPSQLGQPLAPVLS